MTPIDRRSRDAVEQMLREHAKKCHVADIAIGYESAADAVAAMPAEGPRTPVGAGDGNTYVGCPMCAATRQRLATAEELLRDTLEPLNAELADCNSFGATITGNALRELLARIDAFLKNG